MKKNIRIFLLSSLMLLSFSVFISAQSTLKKITKSGVLKVGTTGTQPPFSMEAKDGTLIGFEIDLAELLAESMNLELELVRLPFTDLLTNLEAGKVDVVMSGMSITMERNMKAAFVGPYVLSGKSILTKMESLANVNAAEELNESNLKVTSLKGSTSEKFVKVFLPEATSLPAEDYDKAIAKLLSNEANVMVADYPVCVLNILKNPNSGLVTLTEPLTVEPIGMALPPSDPLFINFMENYINALTMNGLLSELEEYWFNNGSWLVEMK